MAFGSRSFGAGFGVGGRLAASGSRAAAANVKDPNNPINIGGQEGQSQSPVSSFLEFLRNTGQLNLGRESGTSNVRGQVGVVPVRSFFDSLGPGELETLTTQELIDRFSDLNEPPPSPLNAELTQFRFNPQVGAQGQPRGSQSQPATDQFSQGRQGQQVDFSQFGRGPVSPLQQTAFPERQQRFQPQVPGNRLANIGR